MTVAAQTSPSLASYTLRMIRAFLVAEDCRTMPMADRLALEVTHADGRTVFEIVDDLETRPEPRDPDGHVVSNFYEALDLIGWLGIREVVGVRRRGVTSWGLS